jgi:hypothetical protein
MRVDRRGATTGAADGGGRSRAVLPDRRALSFFLAGAGLALAALLVRLPWRLIGLVLVAVVLGRLLLGRRVRATAFAAGAILPVVIAGVALFGRPAWEQRAHAQVFDAAAWRRGGGRDPMWPVRLCMVDDLLRNRDLRGLTREQAVALLGPPADDPPFAGEVLAWRLGPGRGLVRLDSEWLVLRAGPDGLIGAVEVRRD